MPNIPKKIKTYEKRFGNIAVDKGFITPNELIRALETQIQEEIDTGERQLIGQILLEQNAITSDQIKEVLDELF